MPQADDAHVAAENGGSERTRLAARWSAVRPLRALSRSSYAIRGFSPSW